MSRVGAAGPRRPAPTPLKGRWRKVMNLISNIAKKLKISSRPENPPESPEKAARPERSTEQSKPAVRPERPPQKSGHAAPSAQPSADGPRRRRPRRKKKPAGAPGSSSPRVAAESPLASTEQSSPWTPDDFVVPPEEGKTRFHDLGLPDSIMHAVADLGFRYCTPIQAEVLGPAVKGMNVAGRAQTGTGKTAAFLIASFARFMQTGAPADRRPGVPRALVIAPTRELVVQIAQDAEDLGRYCDLRVLAIYGGMDYGKQKDDLARGPVDLIAATPGRLLDFKRQRLIDLSRVEVLVVDEADRMLDMGFIPDVRSIIRGLPHRDRRQSMLFSATLTASILRLASEWMPDPQMVEIEPEQVAVSTVKQLVYAVPLKEKFQVLYNLLQSKHLSRVLVFGNRRDRTSRLAEELERHGVPCELLSGSVPQKKRLRILTDFREGKIRVLVATDVAARGIHIDDVSHVINYELPYEAQDYVHRIGRTGRAGAEGDAISFACENEAFIIPEIEEYIGETIGCRQPEPELLAPLPKPAPRRPRPTDVQSGRPYGDRSRGGRSRPRR